MSAQSNVLNLNIIYFLSVLIFISVNSVVRLLQETLAF